MIFSKKKPIVLTGVGLARVVNRYKKTNLSVEDALATPEAVILSIINAFDVYKTQKKLSNVVIFNKIMQSRMYSREEWSKGIILLKTAEEGYKKQGIKQDDSDFLLMILGAIFEIEQIEVKDKDLKPSLICFYCNEYKDGFLNKFIQKKVDEHY